MLFEVVATGVVEAEAFYIDGDTIHLCPAPCAVVQMDDLAMVKIDFGCDVGYDPNG